MERLSNIINEIYNRFLPLAEQASIRLNLDFSDTTRTVDNPDEIKHDLELQLQSALASSDQGTIDIVVENSAIKITDSGTILSPAFCHLLETDRIKVKSRVGFGTTVTISLETKAKIVEQDKLAVTIKTKELSETASSKSKSSQSKSAKPNSAKSPKSAK